MYGKMIDRSGFLERRKTGIGGSDVAAVAGLSEWRSPLDVFYDKLSIEFRKGEQKESAPVGETAALYWGSVHEAAIGRAYTAVTGKKLMRYNRKLVHPDKPYFIGDVDFLAYCENGKRPFNTKTGNIVTGKGIECKTCRMAGDEWGERGTDIVPLYYICQVQWYMGLIPTIESFDIPVLFGGSDFRIYTVYRDNDVISRLQNIADEFWTQHVVKQIPPPPRSYEEVKRLYPVSSGKSMTATVELERKVRRLSRISNIRNRLEKQEVKLKDEITIEMNNAERLILPDDTVLATFRNEKNGRIFRLKKINR